MGKEIAPITGTPHLQGYCIFKKPMLLTGVTKLLARAHWDVAKGSAEQNFNYCSKDGSFVEHGIRPPVKTQAATKKRKANYELAIELAKKQKIYEIEPGVLLRHMSAIKQIARDHPPELTDNDNLCGYWFHGPPGSGKSRAARWLYPSSYPKPCNKWWDGYQNQPFIIIDDFDTNHSVLGHHLKIWADHYPFIAEQKGHSIKIRPLIICVTSNYMIHEIFNSDFVLTQALKRRFIEIKF